MKDIKVSRPFFAWLGWGKLKRNPLVRDFELGLVTLTFDAKTKGNSHVKFERSRMKSDVCRSRTHGRIYTQTHTRMHPHLFINESGFLLSH